MSSKVETVPHKVKFEVQKVTTNNKRLESANLQSSWQKLGKLEAMSPPPKNGVLAFTDNNVLARVIHTAFYDHYPIRLGPDAIWITIAQGFANHVNENAETLRKKFVNFEGKETITVVRPGFVKGSPNNDWVGVFPEFCDKIQGYIGERTRKMLEANFSTTGIVERTVSQIVLMDAMKSYFNYRMVCGCGIPSIELTGTPDDWKRIRDRVQQFREFDLSWWVDSLVPVLDQFVLASEGKPDLSFWTSICNLYAGSGFRSPITGWIQTFFPYIMSGQGSTMTRNTSLDSYQVSIKNKAQGELQKEMMGGQGCGIGTKLEVIPPGISKVPFVYQDLATSKKYDMFFCGGLTCAIQDDSGTLEPVVGWAVVEKEEKKN